MGAGANGLRAGEIVIRDLKVRRGILLLAVILLVWAVVVLVTGGFVIETPWRPISSRNAVRPLLGGVLLLLVYIGLWRQHASRDLGPLARLPLPHGVAAASTIVAIVAGLGWSPRIAGGPDASGYVSQADLFVRGELTLPAPSWLADAPWSDAARAASPVGYGPSARPDRLAPVYSPGLPMLLALVQVVAGPGAVFFVVPLLAGVAAWATYSLAATLGDSWAGAIATLLLVTSPAFLAMTVQTMSDVPATACWTLALVASLRGHAIAAGLATGMAILIRPNLVLLTAVPAGLLLLSSNGRLRSAGRFVGASAPAVAIIAVLNWYYYESPLRSGYGAFEYLYSISRVPANLRQYADWFTDSNTVLPLLGVFAPLAIGAHATDRGRLLLVTLAFPSAVLAMYLAYLVFQPHEWQYLRFLLPGYPALMTGFSIVVVSLTRRATWHARAIPAVILVAAFVAHGWMYAERRGVFAQHEADRRYAHAVAYALTLPPDAVFVSLAHSGTLRFYTGRDVLRFDAIGGHDIDVALSHLDVHGHPVYLIGDPFEIEMFRDRFEGTAAVRRLDGALATDLDGALVYALRAPEQPVTPETSLARPASSRN
jgi:hypothetical protein